MEVGAFGMKGTIMNFGKEIGLVFELATERLDGFQCRMEIRTACTWKFGTVHYSIGPES